jgi:hypothetical protein
VSGREEPEPYVHANVAVGEVLEPCIRGVVAVGGAFEPCRSTAVGAVGSHRRHGRTRGAIITCYRGEPGWDADLVPP